MYRPYKVHLFLLRITAESI